MSAPTRPVKPPATIGILGSGQLGRMSAMAAKAMGYRVVVLSPERGSPAGQVCDEELVAPYTDPDALDALARQADVVTYEFENVPAATAARLEARGIVHPSSRILHLCQNRLREKETLRRLGVPVTDFAPVDDVAQLRAAAEELGYPCVLKTAEGGYDGKGQVVLYGPEDVAARREDIDAALAGPPPAGGGARCILEAFVPFERELSVIVARNGQGQCASFPVAENVHVDNILHRTAAPAPIRDDEAELARRLAERVAEGLGLVGVMGVEMFARPGVLLVNEVAPRPHNSGHYTLDACVTSQFEQHVRAVCGLPLGSVRQLQAAVMLNILGQHVPPLLDRLETVLGRPNVKVHLYGKAKALPNRKMGHLTVLADTVEEALAEGEALWSALLPDRA